MTRTCEIRRLDMEMRGASPATAVSNCFEPGKVFVCDFLICEGCGIALRENEEQEKLLRRLDQDRDARGSE